MDPMYTPTQSGFTLWIRPWIQAARPAAFPMIFIPLLLGQALALRVHVRIDGLLFMYLGLFGVLYQVFLLYLNDYSDEIIDKTNKQFWLSGGSRVLPQGKLRATDLLTGAKVSALLLLMLTIFLAFYHHRPWIVIGFASAVFLCWAYHFKPLYLSYRGYGETAQGLGCGVLLPLMGFYVQHGSLDEFPWTALVPLYLIFHAGNVITALPDYRSDKAGEKNTCPVRRGELCARQTALALLALAYVSVLAAAPLLSPLVRATIAIPSGIILIFLILSGTLREANVSNFPLVKKFVTWVSISQAWLLCSWTAALVMSEPL